MPSKRSPPIVDAAEVFEAERDRDVERLRSAVASASDPSPYALGSLRRLDALTDDLVDHALSSAHRPLRIRAIECAIERSTDLLPLLDDPDDLIVETAAWALGERPDVGAVEALTRVATEHQVSICREAAVAALGAIGHPDGLDAVLAAMNDRTPVRRRAVLALAAFSGSAVDVALHNALADRDRQVRQAAEDLLDPTDHDPED